MKKNKLIISQLFIAAVLVCTSVYAAVSTTIGISVPNTSVSRGDTITVTLSLRDVDSSKKVTSVEGYVNYNTSIFETITVDSIQKNADNTVDIGNEKLKVEDLTNADLSSLPNSSAYVAFNGSPRGNQNNSKVVIDFNNGITSNTDLLKIDFKVKSDATIGEIRDAISYSDFRITAGSETVEVTEKISLNIQAAGNQGNDNNDDHKNENKNENPSNKNENINDSDNNKNENINNNKNENQNANKNENKNTNKNENKNVNTNKNTNKSTNGNKNTNNNLNKNSNTNRNDGAISGVLPATGAKIVILPAIVLIVIAYVSYKKYVKYKDI